MLTTELKMTTERERERELPLITPTRACDNYIHTRVQVSNCVLKAEWCIEISEDKINKAMVHTALGIDQVQPTQRDSFMMFEGLWDCSKELVILLHVCTSWNVFCKAFLSVTVQELITYHVLKIPILKIAITLLVQEMRAIGLKLLCSAGSYYWLPPLE